MLASASVVKLPKIAALCSMRASFLDIMFNALKTFSQTIGESFKE